MWKKKRGANIPDWAYRDVLFLLIDYSIRSFELLERALTEEEKDEVFTVFRRVGSRMQLKELPANFTDWTKMRDGHLDGDLVRSDFTDDLYRQYKKHLGPVRYLLVLQVQFKLTPLRVNKLLGLRNTWWFGPLLKLYKFSRLIKADRLLKAALLPNEYKARIMALDAI